MVTTSTDGRVRTAARWVAALALVAAGAACGNNAINAGARLAGPTDVVPFYGVTNKNVGLQPYLACTSSRADSLAFIDPVDDMPVLSPMVAFPLQIPTEPRPLLVAAAGMGDRAAGGADVLVAISQGSLELQVVETWTASNRVVPSASVSLDALVPGERILSVVGVTPAAATVTSPRARIVVGVTHGKLVVVDFVRDATGGVVPLVPAGATKAGWVQNLAVGSVTFDPVAMTLEPGGTRAFIASDSPDLHGVGVVDVGGDPTVPWTVTAIDAGAPTSAVAVGLVHERSLDPTNPLAADTFATAAALRIYAVIDPTMCGADQPAACGVVAMSEQGRLPDPSGELPFMAPFTVPGIAQGLGVTGPPASGGSRVSGDTLNPSTPLLVVEPSGRNTSAVAAVSSSDAMVYVYDLSRFSPATDGTEMTTSGIAQVYSLQPADVATQGSPNYGKDLYLGLWNDFPMAAPSTGAQVMIDGTMFTSIQVTPGYTPNDTFLLTWQGVLPALDSLRGVVGRASTGELYVAFQANGGTVATPSWVAVTDVTDPAVGVHAGDLVEVTPDSPAPCGSGELTVASATPVLPAGSAFPGGALHLASGSCFDALAPGQLDTATVSVRASGLVLTSFLLGYLGRPSLDQTFSLQHVDEATATGEALAIARKTRRLYYPSAEPCAPAAGQAPVAGCYTYFPWIANPLAPGPALAFRAGLTVVNAATGAAPLDATDPAVLARLARDARLLIQTQSGTIQAGTTATGTTPGVFGAVPAGYKPMSGGVMPTQVFAYDKTPLVGHQDDPAWFYVTYQDDQLLQLTPSVTGGELNAVR